MTHSVFWVSVNGTEITSTLAPILISIEITDGEGNESDTLELELDDQGGMIEFPPTGADIQAGIMYEDDFGTPVGPPVMFEGKVDKPSSNLARGSGLNMRISAKSADQKGKPKEHKSKHHDKGKFSEVAKKFGKEGGLDVKHSGSIDPERDYWAMQGESFLNWGTRMAREMGLTFKVRGGKALFAERGAGQSIDGQPLPTIFATRPGNIINVQMSPVDDRQTWQKFQVRHYNNKTAKWEYEEAEARSKDGKAAAHSNRYAHADKDSAKVRAKANSQSSDRDKGGGSITIEGEPNAQAEAPCVVQGVRPAIDGLYKIKSARHKLDRPSGYTTTLELVQPDGDAGKDGRK